MYLSLPVWIVFPNAGSLDNPQSAVYLAFYELFCEHFNEREKIGWVCLVREPQNGDPCILVRWKLKWLREIQIQGHETTSLVCTDANQLTIR